MEMFNKSGSFQSKPPKKSIFSKLNDLDNILSVPDDSDNFMDITNENQTSSNELPDFLFPNKFRHCGRVGKENPPRPPIISVDENDYFDDKKKKVTFNRSNTIEKSSIAPMMSQGSTLKDQEILSEEKYWILVFGFNDNNKKMVIERLKMYGHVVKVTQREGCTFLHAKFSNINSAKKAIESGSFFINENVLIGIHQCFNLDFLETETELSDEVPQLLLNKSRINTPLAECRKLSNHKSCDEEDSIIQKIINFLLY